MTNREKIELLKNTIIQMYEKEGRSKSYIARTLEVDRTMLTKIINKEWKLVQKVKMNPSTYKWLQSNKKEIINKLNNDIPLSSIARGYNMSFNNLKNTYVMKDEELTAAYEEYLKRREETPSNRSQQWKKSSYNYDYEEIEGEEWKTILGYSLYQVSNFGRVRKYAKTYDKFYLLAPYLNKTVGRYYIAMVGDNGVTKNLSLARVVAHAFVKGYSEENNTVNHIDRDKTNDQASNLEWVSQAENNQHAYDTGRAPAVAFSSLGRYKKIIVNEKYEFSTVEAAAKFLNKSPTQVRRYLSGETESEHSFKFIY